MTGAIHAAAVPRFRTAHSTAAEKGCVLARDSQQGCTRVNLAVGICYKRPTTAPTSTALIIQLQCLQPAGQVSVQQIHVMCLLCLGSNRKVWAQACACKTHLYPAKVHHLVSSKPTACYCLCPVTRVYLPAPECRSSCCYCSSGSQGGLPPKRTYLNRLVRPWRAESPGSKALDVDHTLGGTAAVSAADGLPTAEAGLQQLWRLRGYWTKADQF